MVAARLVPSRRYGRIALWDDITKMAQERPNRLVEWLLLARKQAPIVKQHFLDWLDECRQEPRLIWETAAVRYTTYLIAGMILIKVVSTSVTAFAPPPPASSKPLATTADFHVLCADSACRAHFVIHRRFGFDDFPVQCPVCKKETGQAARQCLSAKCRGDWRIPSAKSEGQVCPACASKL